MCCTIVRNTFLLLQEFFEIMKNYQRFKEWFQQMAHDSNVHSQPMVLNSTQIEVREVNAGAALVWQVSKWHAVKCKCFTVLPLICLLRKLKGR